MLEALVFLLILGVGYGVRGAVDNARADYRKTRAARVKAAEKAAGGKLPKHERAAVAARHTRGWWTREAVHGFPAVRTGWHAGWIANKTAVARQRVIREEARTEHAETQAGFRKDLKEHQKRQARAHAELERQMAADQAEGSPATGKEAVRRAAAGVADLAAKRAEKQGQAVPPLPADGVQYEPDAPPYPTREQRDEYRRDRSAPIPETARRCRFCHASIGQECAPSCPTVLAAQANGGAPAATDPPAHAHNAEDQSRGAALAARGIATCPRCCGVLEGASLENSLFCRRCDDLIHKSEWVIPPRDSAHLRPGEPHCEGCGGSGRNAAGNDACPACHGFGSAPASPLSPLAGEDAVCGACGHKGTPGDPVLAAAGGYNIHLSHAKEQEGPYQDALNRMRRQENEPGPDAATWKAAVERDGEIDDAVIAADHGYEGEHELPPSPTPDTEYERDLMPDAHTDADEWNPDKAVWLRGASHYQIDYDCRDIGYGPESGSGEFIYRGPADGKHKFAPVDGGPPIYLFPDEITDIRPAAESGQTYPSPTTTEGAPVSDTNYSTVLQNAKAYTAYADEAATSARQRREKAEADAEGMQAVDVDAATLSSQMDVVEAARSQEQAANALLEHATAVSNGLQQRHGGIHGAVQDAPVRAAERTFYEGD